ncbi:hypothetical protein [Pseudovibrio brasiliensis]|uniref:Uncharacterized protein n=1 Tax=Pseudovibrio brasiliensis TaxID=1898042 RepID=A0ABX8AGA6_9HYPH|nr:hypothetical protein [Pseudovibrio brasiliensis]QUS54064.1 hypothetical protein KGB56_11530 [Pseudovibrio brasiliensis]
MNEIRKVPPDAVHVWRGFRSEDKTQQQFEEFLGSVFVPGCSLLQPNAGLHAYIPSLPKHEGKPPTVPDQSALMFWTSQQTYHDAFKCVAVRCYTNLHGDLYDISRSAAEFPIQLPEKDLQPETPYFLIDAPADWMSGDVVHYIGARNHNISPELFRTQTLQWAKSLQSVSGLEGGLLCVGESYIVAWALWGKGEGNPNCFAPLKSITTTWLDQVSKHYELGHGLWGDWSGIPMTAPNSLNIQLYRTVDI